MIKNVKTLIQFDEFYIKLSEKIVMNAFKPMIETISIQSIIENWVFEVIFIFNTLSLFCSLHALMNT